MFPIFFLKKIAKFLGFLAQIYLITVEDAKIGVIKTIFTIFISSSNILERGKVIILLGRKNFALD